MPIKIRSYKSESGRRVIVPTCEQCQILVINGIICHEHGCPKAWEDERRDCSCGDTFKPKHRHQRHCRSCERDMRR